MKKPMMLLGIAMLIATHIAQIQCSAGSLDVTSFGIGGIVTAFLGRSDFIYSCTVQTDDSIVVVGESDVLFPRMAIARYTDDGSEDTTFNSTGFKLVTIGNGSVAQAVGMQSDGKIIFTGYASQSQTDIPLVRLNTDGTTDGSFTISFGDGAQANSIIEQPDNKILVGGLQVSGQANFALARFNSNGTLDTGFGSGGKVATSIGFYATINQITLQANGKIVAAGVADNGGGTLFALARYNTDGSVDTGFGPNSDGTVTTDVGVPAEIHSVAIQSNGYIVVAGKADDSTDGITKFALARYDTSGTLDSSFGNAGIVLTQIQYQAEANSVVIQSDGKIIAGGFTFGDLSTDFVLARYNTDGSLDTSFGNGGISIVNPGTHKSESHITSLALQSTGKIIAAGYSDEIFTIARFLAA
jgi:uncharacterized delta-60 repeat protein